MKKRIAVAGSALLAFAGAAVVATAQEDASRVVTGDGISQVRTVEPEAEQVLSVLEERRNGGDAMPSGPAGALDRKASFGLNPDLSRRAIGNVSHSVFVIPARDHVCVSVTVGEGATLICPDTELLARGQVGPATIAMEGGAVGIYGIVPDGVDSVALEAGSASGDLPVENNIYYTVVPAGIPVDTLRYTGPTGAVEFALHDPQEGADTQE